MISEKDYKLILLGYLVEKEWDICLYELKCDYATA